MPIVEFVGRFHPLLVHLPIGILLLALFLSWRFVQNRHNISRPVLSAVFFLGAISATVSSVTGYLMAQSGSYAENLVKTHQWLGIALTLVSWSAFMLTTKRYATNGRRLLLVTGASCLLLFATGHAGGSLTHGPEFLNPPPVASWFERIEAQPVALTSDSRLYDAVHLVLSKKCISCHGPNKQRGGLRLDALEYMHHGGDTGPAIVSGSATQSLMVERLLLPQEDELHMPPSGRTQPSDIEIELIQYWIDQDASPDLLIADAGLPSAVLSELLSKEPTNDLHPLLPQQRPPEADPKILRELRLLHIVVLPVAQNESHLSASLLNVPDSLLAKALSSLASLQEQVVWLACQDKSLTSGMISDMAALQNLRKLDLRRCRFDKEAIANLAKLENLHTLNLSGARIGVEDLRALEMPALERLHLGLTEIDSTYWQELRQHFPSAQIHGTANPALTEPY